MKRVALFFILITTKVCGQQHNALTRSEFGCMVGGSYYIGDLNPNRHFYNTQFAGGFIYRYSVNARLSLRGNVFFGSVKAADSDSKVELLRNRNLSFQSPISEFASGVEFHYFPFHLGHNRYKGTAYILAELGFFKMNPKTEYNGQLYELQLLGTEGQGTAYSKKGFYKLNQLTIPIGFGCKLSLGQNTSLTLEYAIRKTFTDYLDDVGSDNFVDKDLLSEINGPVAGALSNRNLNGSHYGKRGTSATKDWYAFFGAMVSIRLGAPNKCYNH